MSRKLAVGVLLVTLVVIVAVVLNGDRLYDWLLAMHGARPAH